MAEAGWSERQMGAWSGHDSKREVACYTAAASQGPYDMPWGTDGEHGVVANLTNETGKPRSPVKSTELRAWIKSGRFCPGAGLEQVNSESPVHCGSRVPGNL